MKNAKFKYDKKNQNNVMVITSDLYRGGVAESTRKILKYLSQKENTNTYCVIYDDLPITKDIPDNVHLIKLGCKLVAEYHKPRNRLMFNIRRCTDLLKAIWKLRSLKKNLKINVSYSMMYLPNLINIITRSKHGERALISERQNPKFDLENKPAFVRNLFAHFYKKADGIHINSKDLGDELVSCYGVKRDKLFHFPNFFFPDEYTDNQMFKPDNERLKVLLIGRNSRQKGFEYLPMILKSVTTPLEVNIVSDLNSNHPLAQEILCASEIHRVNFLKERANINEVYVENHVFLLTSLWESFGNVVVEAMLSGLPIVSNCCPTGPTQILARKWGLQSTVSLMDDSQKASKELAGYLDLLATDTLAYSDYRKRSLIRGQKYSLDENIKILDNFFKK
ncbi:glycosyltransferase family 4 protein [Gayadomonas joobiniege]|uniref:glycosyltransferase family 4 protein n=1 Tax=Gayadomonas joobiniege TaxID=1234606 RepID=UPI00038260CA|nr:glycosyltransferase family 4 protein [Gayadomonas joobiniege]